VTTVLRIVEEDLAEPLSDAGLGRIILRVPNSSFLFGVVVL